MIHSFAYIYKFDAVWFEYYYCILKYLKIDRYDEWNRCVPNIVVRYLPLVCPSSSISLIWLSSCLRPLSLLFDDVMFP